MPVPTMDVFCPVVTTYNWFFFTVLEAIYKHKSRYFKKSILSNNYAKIMLYHRLNGVELKLVSISV
jgi:hypothetical protein